MSRCFPYPPPGYARKVSRTEPPLIESIKLQSERQQSKTDRKKEKSRNKKHRSKEHKGKSSRSRDLNDQNQKQCIKEANKFLKGTTVEAEQIEKSGLTEEHGQPIWPQSPGYLSDGTQINHKRKRDALPPNDGCKPSEGTQIYHKRKRDALPPNEGCKPSDGTHINLKRKRDASPPNEDCKSSDKTQINHKRERDALPPHEGCKPGKIIRIKLAQLAPLNHREDSSLSKSPTCSTSGCDNPPDQKRDVSHGPIQQKTGFNNSDTVDAVKDTTSKPKIKDPRLVHSVKDISSQVSSRGPIQQKTVFTNSNTVVAFKDATSKPTIKEPLLVHSIKNISSQAINSRGRPIQQKTVFTNSNTVVAVKDATSKPKIKEPRLVHSIKNMSSQVSSRVPIQQNTGFINSDTVVAVEDTTSKPKIKEPHSVIHSVKDISSQSITRSPAESAYEALFEKWAPPPLQLEQHMDDEEWLFGGTRQQEDGHTTKTNKAFSTVPSCRSSSLWPRGQYLPDADLYSLPYTIPF